ncbi:phage tail tape measure protein, partial [Clostridium botulinum]|nr:phage tail tape measure protein [Clostridium botulinum]
ISLTDSNGKVKEGKALYDELRQKFSGLTDAQKTQSAATIFGKEAMSGMLSIINASDVDYKKLYDSLSNCDGVAEEMANTMNDNLKGSLVLLGSAVEGAGIAFYEKFSAPAKDAVDNVAKWFGNLTTKLGNGELDNTLSGIATGLVTIGTGLLVFNVVSIISNFIGVMNGTATAIGLVAKAQGVWNAVVAMSPIGWIVTIIAALTAGIIVLWNTNEGFRNAVIDAWNAILGAAQTVWGGIVNFFTVDIPAAWQSLLDFFNGAPGWFADLWATIQQAFVDGWNAIVNFFTQTIPQWINSVGEWFNKLPYLIGYALGYALATIVKWGVDTWNYLSTNVPIWINNVVNFFATLPGRIWTWLVNTISRVAEFAVNLASRAREAGANMVTNIVEAVRNLPSRFLEIGRNIVQGVWNGITGMGGWIRDRVNGFFSGIVDGAKDAMGIHSPSRVFRDQVGKYMAQGVGVGFEDETDNIKRSMQKDLSSLTAKMQTTVDLETSRTSRAMTARVNKTINNTNETVTHNDNGLTLKVDKFINNTKQDIKDIAEELEFYRKRNSLATGGV